MESSSKNEEDFKSESFKVLLQDDAADEEDVEELKLPVLESMAAADVAAAALAMLAFEDIISFCI